MEHFWDTIETIGAGYGFSLFGARHLATLALFVGFAALSCKLYKEADEKKRAGLRKLFAVLLLVMAVPIYAVNCLLDTNFMFLMYAPDGNPLAWFRDHFGSHWIGFPVLLAAVGGVMYLPVLRRRRRETAAEKQPL